MQSFALRSLGRCLLSRSPAALPNTSLMASASAARGLSSSASLYSGVSQGSDGIRPAVTTLSETEEYLRDTLRKFATEKIGPKVAEMDRTQTLDREVSTHALCFSVNALTSTSSVRVYLTVVVV